MLSVSLFCRFVINANALLVPREEAMDAFIYLDCVVPTKLVELADIGKFEHSAVGFGLVPQQLTSEANLPDNLLRALLDAELLSCANIDVAVANFLDSIAIYAEFRLLRHILPIDIEQAVNTSVGHLFAPQELTHRCPSSPECHLSGGNAVAR